MSYPMYFPPAPFDLDAAIRASSLVDTAYDMYAQWKAQHKPRPEAFVWKPNSDLDLQFSAPLWGEDKRLLILASREPFAFVAWSAAGEVFLVFRGSESAEDWAVNVSVEQLDYALVPGYGRAHDGFYRVYSSMSASVQAAVAAGCTQAGPATALTIAGHSLGSALSTLAVPDLLAHLPTALAAARISHYNLASPRTGDADFAAAYDANGVATYRVVNVCDLVPEVPPCFIGDVIFQHVGIPVDFSAQYRSLGGNHSAVDSYGYALHHPAAPQGPLPAKSGSA